MNIQRFIVVLISMFVLTACHQGGDESGLPVEQDVRLAPGEYVVDEPENLTAYFEMLCSKYGAEVAVHIDDFNDSLKVWQTVGLLDDYAAGMRAYYPADEVRRALDEMAFQLGCTYNHNGFEDTTYPEIFFFRFLEQAVRLCPIVDFVTDFHSSDGSAGILNYREWNPDPLYSFLIYPTNDGLRAKMIGETGSTTIEKLFHLSDSVGREYYLCSNNGNMVYQEGIRWLFFCQHLFMRDGDDLREVASHVGPNCFVPKDFNDSVIFNPRLLRWDCCRQSGEAFVRIEGTPSLLLHLDGDKSRFVVIE